MLVGLLSDAHGNPHGLERCLHALRREGAERIHFLGDAVGYLPAAAEVLALLADCGAICQKGNHEAMMIGELPLDPVADRAYGLARTREAIGPGAAGLLASWPDRVEITDGPARALLVHGSPAAPLTDYVFPDGEHGALFETGFTAVFTANTHRPFVARRHGVTLANVGSCGLPRDRGDHASCALYNTTSGECDVLRVPIRMEPVLRQLGDLVHPIVTATFSRRPPTMFGRVVTAP